MTHLDDIEQERTVTEEEARALVERMRGHFRSIECLGDRIPHGRFYDREGAKLGAWWSLPPHPENFLDFLAARPHKGPW